MQIEQLISEYKIDIQLINSFLLRENIDILKDGSIPVKRCQRIITFIDHNIRLDKSLSGKKVSYTLVKVFQTMIYTSNKEGYPVCDPFVGHGI